MLSKYLNPRTLAVVVLLLILATASFGFAAANTVTDTYAGDGIGNVLGYNGITVAWALNAANPSQSTGTTLTFPSNVGSVYVLLRTGAASPGAWQATWTDCSPAVPGLTATCTFAASVNVAEIWEIRVVSTD